MTNQAKCPSSPGREPGLSIYEVMADNRTLGTDNSGIIGACPFDWGVLNCHVSLYQVFVLIRNAKRVSGFNCDPKVKPIVSVCTRMFA
jgi:hypothetical protein